jgi:TM2 domain-containing membrane protein YozV
LSNLLYKQELSSKQLVMVESELEAKKKNPVIAWLLWFFLGGIGGHRFYLGDTGRGVAMLFLNWCTFGIWGLLDAFFINANLVKKNEAIELDIITRVKTLTKE